LKGSWRINQENSNKIKSPNIVTVIKVCRLELGGNVATTDGEGTVKKLLEGKARRREKGSRILRWMDGFCQIGL
jgi:hypothetical protein